MTKPSIHNEQYVATFLDDYTHYTVTFVLHHKSDIAERFEEYKQLACAKFNNRIATLRCDNALEITAGRMKNYCVKRGIQQQPAEPYEHQHNGRVERFNRTIMERARAMLFECGAPTSYWSFAVYAATYLINRTPSTAINGETPYERWFGTKPVLKHLRIFGSLAHTHIPPEKRTKLDRRSKVMNVVGFSDTGYLLIDPKTNETTLSSNVLVDESQKWPNSTPSTSSNATTPINIEDLVEEIYIDENPPANDEITACTVSALVASTLESSELSYEEAITIPEWKAAINAELKAMESNEVWKPVDKKETKDAPQVDARWTLKKKITSSGETIFKARLCARGFKDKTNHGLANTYAPVIRIDILRGILVKAVREGLFIIHADVCNAFLNSPIKYELYLTVEGLNELFRVLKEIYGLRTSAKSWHETLTEELERLGFRPLNSDPCIFVNDDGMIIVIFVDDLLFIGKEEKKINDTISAIKFKLKNLGQVRRFLGIDVEYDRTKQVMRLSQSRYIEDALKEYQLNECNPSTTPGESGLKIVKATEENKELETLCRSMVGKLIYIATCTRPDIAYAVNLVSRYQSRPTIELVQAIKRIFRYLRGTSTLGLQYVNDTDAARMEIYTDSDYAGDLEDRKSTSGQVIQFYGNTISWSVRKQRSVTMSTAEAEYLALSFATTSFYGWKNCLSELGEDPTPATIWCDSSAAIAIAQTNESRRTRHIDVAYHNTRDAIKKGDVIIRKIDSKRQLADIMTKNTTKEIFVSIRDSLSIIDTANSIGGC